MPHNRTTLSDIAARLNISKSAVSLALKDSPSVSPALREKVKKTARALGYSRNELVSAVMSSMKRRAFGTFSESIAVINGNPDENALKNHPTLPKYFAGIKDEARKFGYSLNEFWLHSPDLAPKKLARALRSRGIRGGVIIGHSIGNTFPDDFSQIWRDFYFISIGIKTNNPTLEMVSADHYAITYRAAKNAVKMGFKRPALALDMHIDELVDGRFVAGFLRAQLDLPEESRIPPFTLSESAPEYSRLLCEWVKDAKPDAVLHLMDSVRTELQAAPQKVSKGVKLIQLERRKKVADWVGMEQNNDIVGRVAIRRLADMLNRDAPRRNEISNLVSLVPPTWIDPRNA